MTPFINMIFALTIGTSAGLRHCDRVLPQSKFEAAGGRLVEISGLSSKNLARELGCSSGPCFGANIEHAMISEDGSVVSTGTDHSFGKGAAFDFSKHVEQMRYAPPRLAGKPICVTFDVGWEGENPGILRKLP